jgi:aldose 1-epimerase
MGVHTLENHTWHLGVLPERGASIVALRGRVGGDFAPVMRETPREAIEEGKVSRFSSFALAPYSNRIRAARFVFAGKTYALRPTTAEGTAQHGDVRARPFQVVRHEPSAPEPTIEASFDARHFDDINFPFPFTLRLTYRLFERTFETRLELTNVGREPMPAGFGIHPYFVRKLGPALDVALGFRATGVYVTGPDLMPTRAMESIPPELDFSTPRLVGDLKLDHVFGGFDGRATLSWPGSGATLETLELDCDPIFSHFILYTAPDGTLAVEPVTHATDGFNLLARGVSGTGVRTLEPGEAMAGAVRLRLV